MKKENRPKRLNDPRDYCRTCGHADWIHVKTYYWACGREPRNGFDASFYDEICPCKEFIPSDNLEYLEWRLKRSHNETPG